MRIHHPNQFLLLFLMGLLAAFRPGTAAACERCFGAGADSPTVAAIGLSMLSLLVMVGFVFTGIVRFFNQSNERSKQLSEDGRSSNDGAVTRPDSPIGKEN